VGDETANATFSIAPDGTCTGARCTATVTGDHTVSAAAATPTSLDNVSAGNNHTCGLTAGAG
jgi:hypothetical protein